MNFSRKYKYLIMFGLIAVLLLTSLLINKSPSASCVGSDSTTGTTSPPDDTYHVPPVAPATAIPTFPPTPTATLTPSSRPSAATTPKPNSTSTSSPHALFVIPRALARARLLRDPNGQWYYEGSANDPNCIAPTYTSKSQPPSVAASLAIPTTSPPAAPDLPSPSPSACTLKELNQKAHQLLDTDLRTKATQALGEINRNGETEAVDLEDFKPGIIQLVDKKQDLSAFMLGLLQGRIQGRLDSTKTHLTKDLREALEKIPEDEKGSIEGEAKQEPKLELSLNDSFEWESEEGKTHARYKLVSSVQWEGVFVGLSGSKACNTKDGKIDLQAYAGYKFQLTKSLNGGAFVQFSQGEQPSYFVKVTIPLGR